MCSVMNLIVPINIVHPNILLKHRHCRMWRRISHSEVLWNVKLLPHQTLIGSSFSFLVGGCPLFCFFFFFFSISSPSFASSRITGIGRRHSWPDCVIRSTRIITSVQLRGQTQRCIDAQRRPEAESDWLQWTQKCVVIPRFISWRAPNSNSRYFFCKSLSHCIYESILLPPSSAFPQFPRHNFWDTAQIVRYVVERRAKMNNMCAINMRRCINGDHDLFCSILTFWERW